MAGKPCITPHESRELPHRQLGAFGMFVVLCYHNTGKGWVSKSVSAGDPP